MSFFGKVWNDIKDAGNSFDKNVLRPTFDVGANIFTLGGYGMYQNMQEMKKQTAATEQYYSNQASLASAQAAEAGRQASMQAQEVANRQRIADTIAQLPTTDTRKVQVATGDQFGQDTTKAARKKQFQMPEGDTSFLLPISVNGGTNGQ